MEAHRNKKFDLDKLRLLEKAQDLSSIIKKSEDFWYKQITKFNKKFSNEDKRIIDQIEKPKEKPFDKLTNNQNKINKLIEKFRIISSKRKNAKTFLPDDKKKSKTLFSIKKNYDTNLVNVEIGQQNKLFINRSYGNKKNIFINYNELTTGINNFNNSNIIKNTNLINNDNFVDNENIVKNSVNLTSLKGFKKNLQQNSLNNVFDNDINMTEKGNNFIKDLKNFFQERPILRNKKDKKNKEIIENIKQKIGDKKKLNLSIKIQNNHILNEKNVSSEVKSLDTKKWSQEEENILFNYIKKKPVKNWKKISDLIKSKTPKQCKYHWEKLRKEKKFKRWTQSENLNLIHLYEKHTDDWVTLSKNIPNRTIEEIENQYRNFLDPNLKRGKFEMEEDEIIIKGYNKLGNKWIEIAKLIKNRSPLMIKNRFYSKLSRTKDLEKNQKHEKNEEIETISDTSSFIEISNKEMNNISFIHQTQNVSKISLRNDDENTKNSSDFINLNITKCQFINSNSNFNSSNSDSLKISIFFKEKNQHKEKKNEKKIQNIFNFSNISAKSLETNLNNENSVDFLKKNDLINFNSKFDIDYNINSQNTVLCDSIDNNKSLRRNFLNNEETPSQNFIVKNTKNAIRNEEDSKNYGKLFLKSFNKKNFGKILGESLIEENKFNKECLEVKELNEIFEKINHSDILDMEDIFSQLEHKNNEILSETDYNFELLNLSHNLLESEDYFSEFGKNKDFNGKFFPEENENQYFFDLYIESDDLIKNFEINNLSNNHKSKSYEIGNKDIKIDEFQINFFKHFVYKEKQNYNQDMIYLEELKENIIDINGPDKEFYNQDIENHSVEIKEKPPNKQDKSERNSIDRLKKFKLEMELKRIDLIHKISLLCEKLKNCEEKKKPEYLAQQLKIINKLIKITHYKLGLQKR